MFAKNQSKLRVQIMILFVLLIAGNLLAQPQRQQHPPMPPDSDQILQMVEELSIEIALTEDQTASILDIFQAHFNEVRAAMGDKQDQRGNREEMDKLRKEFEGNINALLNDEQKAGFDVFMKKQGHQPLQQRPNR